MHSQGRAKYYAVVDTAIQVCLGASPPFSVVGLGGMAEIPREDYRQTEEYSFLRAHWDRAEEVYIDRLCSDESPLSLKFYCAFVISEFGTSNVVAVIDERRKLSDEETVPLAKGLVFYLDRILARPEGRSP